MVFLPVVTRELLVRSRAPGTYHLRLAAGGILSLLLGVFWLLTELNRRGGVTVAGGGMFSALGFLLLLFCLFEGVRNAAGTISDERREGTLGFLFLTDLSSYDVLLGKLAGAGINSLYTVLAVLPVVNVLFLLGGVTGGELVRLAAALLSGLALASACGIWASTRCRDGMMAVLLGFGMLLGVSVGPLLADLALLAGQVTTNFLAGATFSLASPAMSMVLAGDLTTQVAGAKFWWSQLVQAGVTLGLVAHAGWHLRRTWRRDEAARPKAGPEKADAVVAPGKRSASGADVLGQSLAKRLRLRRWWAILVVLTVVSHLPQLLIWLLPSGIPAPALIPILSLPSALAGMAGMVLLIFLSARTFAEARQTGEMEILLTTPIPDRELVRMLWTRLRSVVLTLVAVALIFDLAAALHQSLNNASGTGLPDEFLLFTWLNVFTETLTSALMWSACVWVAMWFGLTSRKTAGAVGKTVGLVPVATTMVTGVGGSLLFGVLMMSTFGTGSQPMWLHPLLMALMTGGAYVGWIVWAQRRLFTQFRRAAATTPGP